jgi:membrane protease YdiL (CAAX protease family)
MNLKVLLERFLELANARASRFVSGSFSFRPPLQQKTQTQRHHIRVSAAVLATALIVRWIDPTIFRISRDIAPDGLGGTMFINAAMMVWYALPAVFVVALLHRGQSVWDELGLRGAFWPGTGSSFCFAVPMLVGYALMGKVTDISLPVLIINQLRAALREEIFYRAFLFGQLFRHGRWGFVPAVALSAVVFAAGHLYQAQSLSNAVAVFVITFIGAIWFAWLFVAWGYNLWLPIGMHFWMNMWWELFQIDQTAFSGSPAAELPRLLTVLVSIAWTLRLMKQRAQPP